MNPLLFEAAAGTKVGEPSKVTAKEPVGAAYQVTAPVDATAVPEKM